MINFEASKSFAQMLDETDPLKTFRDKFYIPKTPDGKQVIYLCGNSLGLQPKIARSYIEQELEDWAKLAVEGHFKARNPWMPYHELLTKQMAEIVGAKPIEVVVMNSLTVNLHLLMVSFYRPNKQRYKIIIEKGAFPSDQYAVKSQIKFHGLAVEDALVELCPRKGEVCLQTEDIIENIRKHADTTALILLGGVNYYTGQAFNFEEVTKAGHEVGAVVGFDLAHAAGNLELKLHDWNIDFAVWCSYKYLNAGPGAVGGAFVHERYARSFDLPRFAGWWGHNKNTRFNMPPDFDPMPGAEGWQVSNPPIFQMAALKASLDIFCEAGMQNLRQKSVKLTGYLEFLIEQIADERIKIITPRNPDERGCQLSIQVKQSDKRLFEKLLANGVIADWREPDVIRVAPVPLYNTFGEMFEFYEILKRILSKDV
ncbi:MAG: kynureninase [Pyrinomonadaceae bacterium]|nr:kynureninase [Pyrinomonadaceae bacterium]MCX7640357.1 kynureninase [Pyrinomonadaceae bacterium]MDW8304785.1 kynureninase [Acidobacteriota bacterium]